jgi:hypothetical protein
MTNQIQIHKAKNVAKSLEDINGVTSSTADDWDDYGGFNLIVCLDFKKDRGNYLPNTRDFNMIKITNEIRRRIKEYNAYIKEVPKRIYEKNGWDNNFVGYYRDYIMIDLRVPEE